MGVLNDMLMASLQVIRERFQPVCVEATGGMNISYFADCYWSCGGSCESGCDGDCTDECSGYCISSCDGAAR